MTDAQIKNFLDTFKAFYNIDGTYMLEKVLGIIEGALKEQSELLEARHKKKIKEAIDEAFEMGGGEFLIKERNEMKKFMAGFKNVVLQEPPNKEELYKKYKLTD